MVNITFEDDKAYIETPYNELFVQEMHKYGDAHFDRYDRCWVVPVRYIEKVRETLRLIYGEDDQGETTVNKIDVVLTFRSDVSERREIVMFGRVICKAFSRDGGGRLGDGVELLEGEITSGGSIKNPCAVIKKDAKLLIQRVDLNFYESEKDSYGDSVEIENLGTMSTMRDDLLEEKRRIETRLKEINELLACEDDSLAV